MRADRLVFAIALAAAAPLAAQDRRGEQFYYPGDFNWTMLRTYPEAARLFNAFDYGHAVLYEVLLTAPDSARQAERLAREYRYLTTDLLLRPPRFAVAEEAIMPSYARLAWKAKQMFDWAHVLHRQLYDIYADESLPDERKRALAEQVTDYYLSRRDLAFAAVPKSMALMDEQHYSHGFHYRHQSFNGLIWAYHWLQIGLYEPLIAGTTPEERKAGVGMAVGRFWEMLVDAPRGMPRSMPMTPAVAPRFTERHPRAAAIFDNLHMMHDIVSDILVSDSIPARRKRAAIYEALAELQDSTRNLMGMEHWHMMGEMGGGLAAMGGAVPLPGRVSAPPPAHRHD